MSKKVSASYRTLLGKILKKLQKSWLILNQQKNRYRPTRQNFSHHLQALAEFLSPRWLPMFHLKISRTDPLQLKRLVSNGRNDRKSAASRTGKQKIPSKPAPFRTYRKKPESKH